MSYKIDVLALAHEIAEIAGKTKDADTGRLLMDLVERLLRAGGLPPSSLHA